MHNWQNAHENLGGTHMSLIWDPNGNMDSYGSRIGMYRVTGEGCTTEVAGRFAFALEASSYGVILMVYPTSNFFPLN